jgi:hypothetical protein
MVGFRLSVGGVVSSVGSSVGELGAFVGNRVEGGDIGISCGGVDDGVGGRVGRGVVGDGGVDDGCFVDGGVVVVSVGTGPSGAIPPRSQFHSAGGAVDSSHPVLTIQSLW